MKGVNLYAHTAITSVAAVMSASPASERLVYLSWNTTAAKPMETSIESLSMGTTTLTTPCWMAKW